MKNRILLSLFLVTLFLAAPVFAQLQMSDLKTEFIKLENFRLSENTISNEPYVLTDNISLTKEQEMFLHIFTPLLSKRGEIEIVTRSNTLIITDIEKRVVFLKKFIKILDQSNLSFDEITSHLPDGVGKISVKVLMHNLPLSICGGQNEASQGKQKSMFFSVTKNILSSVGNFEVDGKAKTFTFEDTQKRVAVIKRIAELFDQQTLEDEKY